MRSIIAHAIGGIVLCSAAIANAQPATMSDEQQAWMSCSISRQWCVTKSVDKGTREERAVAMVSAKKPAYFHGQISRVTLQVACSHGKPTTVLMTGREINEPEVAVGYRVDPTGKSGKVSAEQVGARHFFELQNRSFFDDLKGAKKATIGLTLPSDGSSNTLEFDVSGGEAAIKRLNCF